MARTQCIEQLRGPRAVWWALLVAVLFALYPTLGHVLAFAGVDGAQRMEICTSQGPQTLAPERARAADAPVGEPAAAQPHCAFCLHQADRFAPVPQDVPALLLTQLGRQPVPLGPSFFYLGTTALWAPPRGPPVAFAN